MPEIVEAEHQGPLRFRVFAHDVLIAAFLDRLDAELFVKAWLER